ncbi:GntR family transcriptional regulator [Priestia megaterium]|uniref:MocR-like pyridoxine biosynthesis transcription factor PdxR n=1 Tax=Priestia megaterium TaxID=1404 RepID=UPI000BFB18D1|nr:PLP-dependent aminotransferase family protein [Priestia megaterium]PGH75106.1 GntR family transcriptional regulator [Priestia megaterium]PGX15988.1 GntR family transcriptional regulator [Priestia megaterium]
MFLFTLDRSSNESLTKQVYKQIRDGILTKKLREGEKLFSTRELASSIGVSRNVVLEAYEQLIAEGYLDVRPRSGTYVAKGSSLQVITDYAYVQSSFQEKTTDCIPNSYIDFRAGNPAIDHFPRGKWGSLAKEICSDLPEDAFGYADAEGAMELRDVLAHYLLRVRGVKCHPSQIIITSGATQALHLITEFLCGKGNLIAVEDPVTDEMRAIFSYAGAKLYPVSIDERGIIPELLPLKENPKFVFTIPSHQFPLGGTLPIQRRVQLIEYARKKDCFIVEDDYDSEFTYEGVPVPSVQGLDPERVIYVGTFSKILAPALRIGYVVLPYELIKDFRKLKWFTDRHTSSLEQLVLARFIEKGYLDRHVRRMKKIYRERRKTLVSCLRKHFTDAKILGQAAGMHLVVELPKVSFTEEVINRIKQYGVIVYPVERYALQEGIHQNKIVMGYGSLTVESIKKGVERLKMALEEQSNFLQ